MYITLLQYYYTVQLYWNGLILWTTIVLLWLYASYNVHLVFWMSHLLAVSLLISGSGLCTVWFWLTSFVNRYILIKYVTIKQGVTKHHKFSWTYVPWVITWYVHSFVKDEQSWQNSMFLQQQPYNDLSNCSTLFNAHCWCMVSSYQFIEIRWIRCQADLNSFPLGQLEETTGTLPPILRGWRLPSRTWNQWTSPWMKQLTWLRIAHSGDWCLRLALRTHSGACQKWMNEWNELIKCSLHNHVHYPVCCML